MPEHPVDDINARATGDPTAKTAGEPPMRRQIELRDAIKQRLAASTDADLSTIGVRVEDGMVTVVGAVDSEEARAVTRRIAGAVPGVARVVDLLLVASEHAAIEQTMAADASSRRGSSRGASPQEAGLVPSAEHPLGPWAPDPDDDMRGSGRSTR